jgi:hypothetical protein
MRVLMLFLRVKRTRLMNATDRLRAMLLQPAVRHALIIFIVMRAFLAVWAIIALTLNPLPLEPDETLRPYLGEPALTEGVVGSLLGPWQRFDTLHYIRIAREGYAHVGESSFPPLYPLAIRGLGALLTRGTRLLGGNAQNSAVGYLLAGLLLSNLAFLGSLIVLYLMAAAEMEDASATRTVVYAALFPTGFFLLGAYTEPIFLFLALSSVWAARRGRPWLAGALGGLASLSRLTGWVLVVPLSYEYLRQRNFDWRQLDWSSLAALLPPAGLAGFLGWRWWAGLPPLAQVFADTWLYRTTWPGADLIAAIRSVAAGQAPFVLIFNLACAGLLIATAVMACRRLPAVYGLYMVALLLVTLMTAVDQRPLNSLSRYTLAFFPAFMVLGQLGRRAWVNRLILYPSLLLFLYLSGQFFVWGWVA